MTRDRWRQIEEIYQEAADLGVADRKAFLDESCSSDRELRTAVEGLLEAHEDFDGSIEAAIREEADKLAAEVSELVVGERIGQYRVTALIGAGGMGSIYRAVRDDNQYQKEVAIKVVKRGMDHDAVLKRFWLRTADPGPLGAPEHRPVD
jgi:serine/threonine protein kinase